MLAPSLPPSPFFFPHSLINVHIHSFTPIPSLYHQCYLTAENGESDGVPPEGSYVEHSGDVIDFLVAKGTIGQADIPLVEDIVDCLTENCTLVKYLPF